MILRKEHFAAFEHAARTDFKHRMLAHLAECQPQRYRELGRSATESIIEHGMAEGPRFGIQTQQHVCRFIDLLVYSGAGFYEPSQHPREWAILSDSETPADQKLEHLLTLAERHGAYHEHQEGLERVRDLPARPGGDSGGDLQPRRAA